MNRLLSQLARCGLVLAVVLSPALVPGAKAQPIIDGITFGTGLSMYHGNFDWNREDRAFKFLANGTPHVFAMVDRAFGPMVVETGLTFDRVRMASDVVDARLTMLSADFTVGVAIPVPAPFFFRVFAGVSPAFHSASYDRINESWQANSGYEELTTRLYVSFPVGIVIQDVVRIGVRIAGDGFDGATANSPLDLVSFVSVGYRIDLLR